MDNVCTFPVRNHFCGVADRRRKTLSVIRWPSCLILVLKRFAADWVKISTAVSFQLALSVTDDITYGLRGVVMHNGDSARAGHYTAYVRGREDRWFFSMMASSLEN